MPFLSFLDTRAYAPGEFVLTRQFGYQGTLDGVTFQLWAERGYITDFASIPWLVQRLPGSDVNGASRPAAIPHDRLYSACGKVRVTLLEEYTGVPLGDAEVQFSRSECDEIFRMALLDIGRDPYTRHMVKRPYHPAEAAAFYAGVRSGGWYHWGKRKRRGGFDPAYDLAPVHFLNDLEGGTPCETPFIA